MSTKYIVADTTFIPDAIIVDKVLSKSLKSGKKAYTYKDRMYLVEVSGSNKKVIDVTPAPPYDFCFTPVADVYEDENATPDPIYEDYRDGLINKPQPVLPDFRRAAAGGSPLVMRATIATDGTLSYLKTTDKHAGTSTWYGDTPNVISWNGCGAMDAAQNAYSAVNQAYSPERWQNPPFELQYYSTDDKWGAPPESPYHLAGDRAFANKQFKPPLEGKVYRNGVNVATLPHAVISACEYTTYVDSKPTLRLRVICAPWLDPTQYNPLSGDTDYYFSANTIRDFYLYEENPKAVGGWDLHIIPIPTIDAEHDRESFIAQAPIFSADGNMAFGIIETAFFFGSNLLKQYHNGKWRNQSQAREITINASVKVMSLGPSASKSEFEQDFIDNSASIYSRDTKTQVLSLAPLTNESVRRLKRIDRITTTKNRPDNDVSVINVGDTFWAYGTQEASEAAALSMVNAIVSQALPLLQQWFIDNNPTYSQPELPGAGISFNFDALSATYPQYDQTYHEHPYVGESGFTQGSGIYIRLSDGAWVFNDLNGVERNSSPEQAAASIAQSVFKYIIPDPAFKSTEDQDGNTVSFPVQKTRSTTTLTDLEYRCDEDILIKNTTTRVVTVGGSRTVGFGGNQVLFANVASHFAYGDWYYPQAWLHVNQSYGPSRPEPSSDITTGSINAHRVVAADMRKNAVIIKDVTASEFHYYNVPAP